MSHEPMSPSTSRFADEYFPDDIPEAGLQFSISATLASATLPPACSETVGSEPRSSDDLQPLLQMRGSTEANAQWDATLFAPVRADIARLLREDVPVAREAKGGPIPAATNSRDTRVSAKADTSASVLARLKRDDPSLADRVVAGELTSHRSVGHRNSADCTPLGERVA